MASIYYYYDFNGGQEWKFNFAYQDNIISRQQLRGNVRRISDYVIKQETS